MSETNEKDGKGETTGTGACVCGPFCFEVTPGAMGVTIRIEATDPARAAALKTLACCPTEGRGEAPRRGCCGEQDAGGPGAGGAGAGGAGAGGASRRGA